MFAYFIPLILFGAFSNAAISPVRCEITSAAENGALIEYAEIITVDASPFRPGKQRAKVTVRMNLRDFTYEGMLDITEIDWNGGYVTYIFSGDPSAAPYLSHFYISTSTVDDGYKYRPYFEYTLREGSTHSVGYAMCEKWPFPSKKWPFRE